MQSHGSLESFPLELVLNIYSYLGVKSQARLAITCRNYFESFQANVNPTPFTLEKHVTIIQLRTLTTFIIGDTYCNPRIISHIFTYCYHLERFTFMRRHRPLADAFLDIFFNSTITRRIMYSIPICYLVRFRERRNVNSEEGRIYLARGRYYYTTRGRTLDFEHPRHDYANINLEVYRQ